jgi:hypothetical protein
MSWNTVKMGNSSLVLHTGAKTADWDKVIAVETPDPSPTWMPVPHARVIEEIQGTLERTGLSVQESAYALNANGAQFFGLLALNSLGGGGAYQLVVGVRNSHDKSFPVGMVVGSRVFVCDNLAFSSEIQVTRRHTKNVMDDFPRLIATACGRIRQSAATQEARFEHYKQFEVTDAQVHDLLVQSLDIKALGSTALPRVLKEWREPSHPEFAVNHSVWRLWNAYTEVYKGYDVGSLGNRTIALQGLLDAYSRFQAPEVVEALAV